MANKDIAAKTLITVSERPRPGNMLLINVLKTHKNMVTPKMTNTIFSFLEVVPNFST